MDGKLIRARIKFEIVSGPDGDLVRFEIPDGAVYHLPIDLVEDQVCELAELLARHKIAKHSVTPINPRK